MMKQVQLQTGGFPQRDVQNIRKRDMYRGRRRNFSIGKLEEPKICVERRYQSPKAASSLQQIQDLNIKGTSKSQIISIDPPQPAPSPAVPSPARPHPRPPSRSHSRNVSTTSFYTSHNRLHTFSMPHMDQLAINSHARPNFLIRDKAKPLLALPLKTSPNATSHRRPNYRFLRLNGVGCRLETHLTRETQYLNGMRQKSKTSIERSPSPQ